MPRITRSNKKKRIAALLFLIIAEEETHRNNPRIWTHPYLLKRNRRGMHYNLFTELLFEDPDRFRRCLRMNTALFENLLEKVTPIITKQDTHLRQRISPAERLSLTLRHLATGIIKEVCTAIIHVLREDYLRIPSCEDEWRVVADDFGYRWNFYNCVGAMDGKHFKIDPPLQSGSLYYNYKDSCSVVLPAVVDAQLRFIYVDVGTNGRISDT
ncbi:PREDICTED: uncharacterized protein LOC108757374, partial [Trachymyrmex cornetzi]|uniref:uncharacterized protein LOC108757374 n=1 Tax=Trachymyrmex cornetzi TaxID=471704 RepID=UPI00084F6AD6